MFVSAIRLSMEEGKRELLGVKKFDLAVSVGGTGEPGWKEERKQHFNLYM